MEPELEHSLKTAIRFLEENKIPYAIIGGVAVSKWGYNRYTGDVDLKILVSLNDHGIVREKILGTFPRRARPHLKQEPLVVAVYVEDVIVDFLLTIEGYDELVVKRAVKKKIGGWTVNVCSREDLIVLKVAANRDKDWLDIRQLLMRHVNKLDHDYILEWIQQFADLLEEPEMIERYKQMVSETKTAKKR